MSSSKTAFIRKYRNNISKLLADWGEIGILMLYKHFEGRYDDIVSFLGLEQNDAQIRYYWDKLSLPFNKPIEVLDGFELTESINSLRKRYLQETSRQELAPIFEWNIPRTSDFGLCVCVSDLHYGPSAMDYRRWLQLRDWIKAHPDVRWIYLGDALDNPTKNSPGYYDTYLNVREAEVLFKDDIAPIAHQCLLILSGNHENRLSREAGVKVHNPLYYIAQHYGIYYGDEETFLRIIIRKGKSEQIYDGYVNHGACNATTLGGQMNYLQRITNNFEVDFIVLGHSHPRLVSELWRLRLGETIEDMNKRKWAPIEEKEVAIAYAGSFLRAKKGTYNRIKIISPAALGSISLHFYADRHVVHARK